MYMKAGKSHKLYRGLLPGQNQVSRQYIGTRGDKSYKNVDCKDTARSFVELLLIYILLSLQAFNRLDF